MMSTDDDGDNKDLKCGAPECNHLRFKSQQEREEHWESNMECAFYTIFCIVCYVFVCKCKILL